MRDTTTISKGREHPSHKHVVRHGYGGLTGEVAPRQINTGYSVNGSFAEYAPADPAYVGHLLPSPHNAAPPLRDRKFADSSVEGNGFELPVRGRGQSDVAPLCRRVLGMGRWALSAFGQHDALHQSGVDPTAEAAIRAGDAQRRLLRGPGSCGGRLQQTQILRCRRVLESAKLGYARRSD